MQRVGGGLRGKKTGGEQVRCRSSWGRRPADSLAASKVAGEIATVDDEARRVIGIDED